MAKTQLPILPNLQPILQAGINPKNGLPVKLTVGDPKLYKDNMKRRFRVKDEQCAIRRYKWLNLPDGLDGELLERILYYKGTGMFFYMPELEQFFFLPYALDGTIDVYGRYTGVTPLPFNGQTSADGSGKEKAWIDGLVRKPQWSLKINEVTEKDWNEKCVILYDYCKQNSQTIIPRKALNEPLLDTMAETLAFARTALINGTGIKGMRVSDADQADSVNDAAKSVENAALTGSPWVPIIGMAEFQELMDGPSLKPQDFMLYLESLDNLRLSDYGIDNGGLFEKKGTMLESEQAINAGKSSLSFEDGLTLRQNFCDIVNSIWGLGIDCVPTEDMTILDTMDDGLENDESDAGMDTSDDENNYAGGTNDSGV